MIKAVEGGCGQMSKRRKVSAAFKSQVVGNWKQQFSAAAPQPATSRRGLLS
jgi:hypothetical protein